MIIQLKTAFIPCQKPLALLLWKKYDYSHHISFCTCLTVVQSYLPRQRHSLIFLRTSFLFCNARFKSLWKIYLIFTYLFCLCHIALLQSDMLGQSILQTCFALSLPSLSLFFDPNRSGKGIQCFTYLFCCYLLPFESLEVAEYTEAKQLHK